MVDSCLCLIIDGYGDNGYNAGTGNDRLINDGGTRANAVKAGLTSNEVDHQPQLDARDKEIEVDPLTEESLTVFNNRWIWRRWLMLGLGMPG